MTSRGDRACQTPELLGPGKGTKRSHSQICASEGCLSAEPERLGPGTCTQPRASPRRFPAEHRRAGADCAPRERTGQAGQRYCVRTTVLFVSSSPPPHSATELVSLKTSKQKKLNRGNHLGSDPTWPITPERARNILNIFKIIPFFFASFF